MSNSIYHRFGKRTVDLAGAGLGLIVLGPLFLIVALLVKTTSRGPAFFRQIRIGQFGRRFRIFKFRTMTVMDSVKGQGAMLTASRDPRITALGRWLRKSKMDELPQLINVLRGNMSLVGPRPEVAEYVATYSIDQRRVLLAKPGITGLVAMNNVVEEDLLDAQADKDLFYRSVLLPAKLRLDLLYCEHVSLREDLGILFGTFLKIFYRSSGSRNALVQSPEKQA